MPRKKTIIWFIDSLTIGGGQKHLVQVATGLSSLDYLIWVICLNDHAESKYITPLQEAGIRVSVVGKRRFLSGWILWKLLPDIIAFEPQMMFSMLFVSTLTARLLDWALNLPLIVCLQARNIDYGFVKKMLLKATARPDEWTFSNSRCAIAFAISNEGAVMSRSLFVPNAIAIEKHERSVTRAFREQRLNRPNFVIGSVGRLVKQKGFDILIDAFAKLVAEDRHCTLVIIGEGPERASLEAKVARMQLSERVHFPGQCERIFDALAVIDIYVQPSRFEGTPNALMEAMVLGVPVVATAVDGIAEIIESNVHGLLVPTENSQELFGALKFMMDHPEARATMATEAKTRMEVSFSPSACVDAYLDGMAKVEAGSRLYPVI